MTPAIREVPGAHEHRPPSTLHTTPGRDASLPFSGATRTAASGASAPTTRRLLLARNRPHPGQETPGTTGLRRVGADATRPRAEPVVVTHAHGR
ncbi:hypothetical protein [Acetobacter senegalensis]|uniref:hypothetical protein n=1 Tax=Acetobacter senegalensis TaxID=446692 RepID=UPI001E3DA32D|nr:hypothetical protein [Acetobacter senegalensis]